MNPKYLDAMREFSDKLKHKVRYSARIGNIHQSFRVTTFHTTYEGARKEALEKGFADFWISETLNWEQHIQWSRDKVGNYAYRQIET